MKVITLILAVAFATLSFGSDLPQNFEAEVLAVTNQPVESMVDAVRPIRLALYQSGEAMPSGEVERIEACLMTNILACVFSTNRMESLWETERNLRDLFSFVGTFRRLTTDENALFYCAEKIGGFQPVSTNLMLSEMRAAFVSDREAIDEYRRRHCCLKIPYEVAPTSANVNMKWRDILNNNYHVSGLRKEFVKLLADPVGKYERGMNETEKLQFRSNVIERAKLDEQEAQLLFR